jgi:hypothetical protein
MVRLSSSVLVRLMLLSGYLLQSTQLLFSKTTANLARTTWRSTISISQEETTGATAGVCDEQLSEQSSSLLVDLLPTRIVYYDSVLNGNHQVRNLRRRRGRDCAYRYQEWCEPSRSRNTKSTTLSSSSLCRYSS